MTEPKIGPLSLFQQGADNSASIRDSNWARVNLTDLPRFDAPSVLAQWRRLHAGQGDFGPPTANADLLEGWACYHGGDFEQAAFIGLQQGGRDGLALANRATAIYANYVEPRESTRLILFRHVAANTRPRIIVQSRLFMAQAIVLEAALSFLGLGQQPPSPSWGQMLNVAKNFMEQAPWMSVAPGVAIFLAVLGFNLLGDGLRDALDPKES